jgi:hypothetical protein
MYQVSDLFNGPIEGAEFATYSEAHDYREFILPDYAEWEAECLELREETQARDQYREPRPITLDAVYASLRNFICIIDCNPSLEDAARIERERLAWNAAALRLGTHPY